MKKYVMKVPVSVLFFSQQQFSFSLFPVCLLQIQTTMDWFVIESQSYVIQMTVKYQNIHQKNDINTMKIAGRYMVGPIKYIIQFPRYQQSIEFTRRFSNVHPLKSRTKEGLEIEIELSFQYQLIKEDIPQLYFKNNMKYEETFIRIARDTIMKSSGHYFANQYWTKLQQIKEDMQALLNKELEKNHARCTGFQLLYVDLPQQFEDSIILTQVEQQKQKLKQFEQSATLIRKDIEILISDNNQKINTILAQANADAYQIKQQAIAEQQSLSIDSESNVAMNIKGQLALNGQEVKKYLVMTELKDLRDAKLVIGLDNPILKTNS